MSFNTKSFLWQEYSDCGIEPEPPTDSSDSKREQEQIVFDEMENPMLRELAKKHPLRPPSFEMLVHPLRMATMIEPIEGAKVDFSAGVSQRLQFTNSWSLNHGQGGSYDISLMYAGGRLTNGYEMMSPSPFLMARFSPSTGRQDIKLIYKLMENLDFKFSANYMSYVPKESHVQLETEYSGNDFLFSAKCGLAFEFLSFNYVQSLTKNLIAGFEVMNMSRPRKMVNISYGGKYTFGTNSLFLLYMAPQQLLQVGAVIKGNPNIQFSTELNYSGMNSELDFIGGISVRFMKAKFNAQISGTGKLVTCLHHALNPFAKVTLTGEADLVKQEQKFGASLSLGDISH